MSRTNALGARGLVDDGLVAEMTLAPQAPEALRREEAILAILSAKTGYPIDMIKKDMDFEADLGIDSIKRVEIFSAIGEKIAPFAALEPTMTGGLRNIADILAVLDTSAPDISAVDLPPSNEATNSAQPASPDFHENTPISALSDRVALERSVIEVIATATGYPTEMLHGAMHLENDLGIDSIKRVEIFSSLAQRVGPAALGDTGRSATWGTIADIVDGLNCREEVPNPREPKKADEPQPQMPIESSQSVESQSVESQSVETSTITPFLSRLVVTATPSPAEGLAIPLKPAARIWVLDDGSELCSLVMGAIKERGGKPRLVDLDYLDRIEDPSTLDGVIALAPAYRDEEDAKGHLARFFKLCTFLASLFDKNIDNKSRFVAAVTRQGGRFGLDGLEHRATCYYGGMSGVLKSAAHEWPDVTCKVIDIDGGMETLPQTAQRIIDTCLREGNVEVGLQADCSWGVAMQNAPLTPSRHGANKPTVGLGDVVVVTGGARGVTAQVAIELAERCQPTMLVLGRSREPAADEAAWLNGIAGEAALKAALVAHAASGTTLADIHQQYERVINDRAMAQTFARIRQAGAVLIYRNVDVRQRQAVMDVVREIRENVGPIRGIVHGAGVLRDRLLKDKTVEQFQEVMATKVDGFCHIMDAVDPLELRLIALFSSSSARYGRRGQGDYAAANEILNKLAQHYRRRLADCHVVALGFGPWQGGMVNPALARLFHSEGIGLIPLDAGARMVVDDMLSPQPSEQESSAEVVIQAATGSATPAEQKPRAEECAPSKLFAWEISLAQQPILADHVIGGRIVVPVVLLIEWLGHAALHGNPGLLFHGFDDLRVLKGIVLGANDVRMMHAYALKAQRGDGLFEVFTEIRGVDASGNEVRHASCKVILAERLPQAPAKGTPLTFAAPYARSREDVYAQFLFHGEKLMGMERILGVDARGCSLTAKAAPPPAQWLAQPLRGHWLADPLILDSAFQAVVLWTRECAGSASLPCAIRSYRQFRSGFPREGCQIELSACRQGEKLVTAEGDFCDQDGGIIARMASYEAVMDASLNEAFRKRKSGDEGICGHDGP